MAKKVLGWKKNFVLCLIFLEFFNAFAQTEYFSWDFSNCDIKDILYAVSLDTGIPIVADDTVSGTGDLKFAGKDFNIAFDSFLKTTRLYVEKTENVWTVSRYAVCKESTGSINFDAYDMSPALMLEKLSLVLDSVITYDTLPSSKMSVHFKNLSEKELMDNLARRFGSYEAIHMNPGVVHFAKKVENFKVETGNSYVNLWVGEDNSYNVDLRNALFSEVVCQLFEKVETETGKKISFCNLSNCDPKITRACFCSSCFDDLLTKLCLQNGCNYLLCNGIYYIFSDEKASTILIFGESNWEKFYLKYTSTDIIFPVIQVHLNKVQCVSVPDRNYFFAKVTESEKKQILELIKEIDIKLSTYVVELKYLKPGEFLQQLPPSVGKEKVFAADDNSSVYFKGTEEEFENLCEQLELIDKPPKRISYDLLILQYDETSQQNFTFNTAADSLTMGSRNNLAAQLGTVLGLNLNVVTAFGINFAASLQASLEKNSTKVFADTTLHGVSGKTISFQNTNTYRYRDNNLDPDTGKPVYSGITKEIVSGITLEIQGWISGEGMITSSVKAVVSRQGIDMSSSTGNPPPTSEKVVTTEVCCKSGEPVVLSGLVQDSATTEKKGLFLMPRENTKEKTQMVIYLVPHIEGEKRGPKSKKYTLEYTQNLVKEMLQEGTNEKI